MTAVLRDSTLFTNLYTNKYLADSRDAGAGLINVPFQFVVASPMTTADSYNLCKLLPGDEVVGLFCSTSGLGATITSNITLKIGDSGDDDRYMAATDFDNNAGGTLNPQGSLAYAGFRYRPTAVTTVVGIVTGSAVVGATVKGHLVVNRLGGS